MFDFVHETFDQMTHLVGMPIGISLNQPIFLSRNNSFSVVLGDKLKDFVTVIAPVSQNSFEIKAFQQGNGLGGVRPLSSGQQQAQGVVQRINGDMDFCAKFANTLTQCLFLLTLGAPAAHG